MTRQPHDQFAKQYLEELLSPFGKVEVNPFGEFKIQNSKFKIINPQG